jgi:hypothetical protein
MKATSREVWKWPEFRALAEKLGVPIDEKGITGFALVIDCKKAAEVFTDLTYLPADVLEKLRNR